MLDTSFEQSPLARKRQQVQALRQQVYTQTDPNSSPELLDQLMAAEQELAQMEMEQASNPIPPKAVLLDTAKASPESGSAAMGKDTTSIDAQVLLRMSHVPTGIAHLLRVEESPLVTFRITYVGGDFVRLRLASFVEGYSARAVTTVELKPDESVEISQLPTFFPDKLQHITELSRATLQIQIQDLDKNIEQENSFPIWLLARTSAYNGIQDPVTGKWLDLSKYFGAWVTPNVEEVMQLLRRAAQLHPDKSIVGYQVDAEGIQTQVESVFNALKEQGIVYVNSLISFGASKGAFMQRVRLPRESLVNKSANCIDGTVLMASVLEAASLCPGIVLVPGHAFLAWQTQEGKAWDYVETTMIGSSTFEAAHHTAQALAKKYSDLANKSKNPLAFTLLSLPDLREREGVTPME